MKLATIQSIATVEAHPNADLLEIVQVKGYKAIVRKGEWKAGDLCVFIIPDTILSPDLEWTQIYRSKHSRVRAIKLRGVWSEGIVESFARVGYNGPAEEGLDLTDVLKVAHYEPPIPQDLAAKGLLPYGICKTDEERIENLDSIPWGAKIDVLQKRDGQSASYYWLVDENGEEQRGVLGRTMEYKTEALNNYTQNQANHDILNKLSVFCRRHDLGSGLCVRGESTGTSIQKMKINPHSQKPLDWAMFSVWLIGERRYARKGEPFYFLDIAKELDLPTVEVLERDVELTPALVKKYAEDLEQINGAMFEGVVIQWSGGSFKVLNKLYDSKK